jgi:uncharacterized membrane protein YeaQ/YmgE (transglycosylase-associated protein family)
MTRLLIWAIFGLFTGSIAKAIVPGEENLKFFQTIALGIAGSYMGGAILYMLGEYEAVSPTGLFMSVVGSVVSLIVYKKIVENKT